MTFAPGGDRVDIDFLDRELNEWDECAIEEALRIRERLGGEVLVGSVGRATAEAALRRCLAMGADRAVRVDTEPWDPISVAMALASWVGGESPDLVLCGAQSSDSVQGATGAALAELLGFPCVAVVAQLAWDGSRVAVAHRELEGGLVDVMEIDMPALITLQTGTNKPRYPTLRSIKQADKAEIAVLPGPNVGVPAYRVRRMFVPPATDRAVMFGGRPAQIAQAIFDVVRERLA